MKKDKQNTTNKANKKAAVKQEWEFTVAQPEELLKFLLTKLSNQSRNHVKALLKYRAVSVDGAVQTRFNLPLKMGQTVRVSRSAPPEPPQANVLDIIYEDDEIIAVNKPAGLLSIATDKMEETTAYFLLTDYVRLQNPENRIFIVHRLDRDTSGVMIVAKTEEMKLALQDNWADLVTQRNYAAIVEGSPKEKSGTMHTWLLKTKTLIMYSGERAGDGLEAITHYQVVKENEEYALLDVQLETGRKNQIRVHMKELGHSVVGDKKYGAKSNPLKRLGLHACKLELKHPFTNELMCFEAPVPKPFFSLFNKKNSN